MKARVKLISHSQNSHTRDANSTTLAEKRPQPSEEPSEEDRTPKESKISRWLKVLRRQFDIWFPETIPTMKLRYELFKKNFIKEVFNSKAFMYPFLVSKSICFL